uniref:Uncharacterized protein n=1 Tax=Rhizophora mucronata TaxID=61149 RepID=A0A2P2IJ09_RHIMU
MLDMQHKVYITFPLSINCFCFYVLYKPACQISKHYSLLNHPMAHSFKANHQLFFKSIN